MWKVEYCESSYLYFLRKWHSTFDFDVYYNDGVQATYYFRAEAQEKADELNASESKFTFVKVECSEWDIATLKDDFEAEKLYLSGDDSCLIGTVQSLSYAIAINGFIYKKVDKQSDLDSDVEGLMGFECASSVGTIIFEYPVHSLSFDKIHELSEILKRHGK